MISSASSKSAPPRHVETRRSRRLWCRRKRFPLVGEQQRDRTGGMKGVLRSSVAPRPVADRITAEFWWSLHHGTLVVQHCERCGANQHPPLPWCSGCLSRFGDVLHFVEVGPRGRLDSYCIIHRAGVPGIALPYCVVSFSPDDAPDVSVIGLLREFGGDEKPGIGSQLLLNPFREFDGVIPAFSPSRRELGCAGKIGDRA